MTLIMGAVNVTPDSFSDGGRYLQAEAAIAHGLELVADGADILDIGGESTRPGAVRIDPALERERVLPVIRELAAAGAVVSVDTMHAETARAAVEAGARIINDVAGGLADQDMLRVAAECHVDLVISHWRGHSDDMYAHAQYTDVARDVVGELVDRMEAAAAAGIPPARIILDPGIGFAKHGSQNWDMLRGLPALVGVGPRVLVGTSRKRFLAELLEADGAGEATERRRDLATAVASVLAAQAGVWAVRVHDVAATRDALRVAAAWRG
ncbi:dihydropteroate synthase [Microbacterium sp. SYP-A9085]|jgi:dihydropteroate synthase|uniref:dihydropteroate synthase n=1 Tax=Microbacterium sp. SYP-A9085 TaxID=2664454 RepID=UPI00129AEF5D|nr:dihydropteroate synthase [Microbacterium sp. SYP-A9085]MRH28139.1 dihydropteroate synthase [Microbacterium sp. SYP-A9085]